MKTRIAFLIAIVLVAVAPGAFAQCADNDDDCTVNELQRKLSRAASQKAAQSPDAGLSTDELANKRTDETAKEVENANRATTAPDPFAARLHSSYQDFLVPLSFALNDIMESEDGRALILRFNPFRAPPVVAGLTVTASKAELDERISAAVPEDQRDEAVKRLNEAFEDLDDVTLAGSFAFESSDCKADKSLCLGRNPRTYDEMLSSAFVEIASAGLAAAEIEGQQAAADLRIALQNAGLTLNTVLGNITDAALRDRIKNLIQAATDADQRDSARFLDFLDREGINQLATLLDNQPQFAVTGTWHDRKLTAGPREMAYTVEYQFGFTNLNSVKRGCKTNFADCLGTTLRTAVKTGDNFSDKFVLSASYKDVSRYQVTGDDVGITGFTAIDGPGHQELSAKLQWGRQLRTRIVGDQYSRIDVNAEGIRIMDGNTRKKNDWIGTATLTIPLMKNMSIPLSLKYGNRRELLADVDDELSAHFGISYRLPWEMEK